MELSTGYSKVWIGIDPGTDGAIAVLTNTTLEVHGFSKGDHRSTAHIIKDAVAPWTELFFDLHAVIEDVHAMPGQGVTSMFKFGYCAGAAAGAIIALGVPLTMISPRKWQSALLQGSAKDLTDSQKKARLIARAKELFPRYSDLFKLQADHNKASAALIAYYCRYHIGNEKEVIDTGE